TAPGAAGSPATVPVTLTVFVPGIAVTPSFLEDTASFGETAPIFDTLTVGISGGGALTWTATKSRPWVSLSQTAGAAPPNAPVIVTLSPAGLAAGTYKDTVVFRSPQATNSPLKIPVELDVVRATLTVSPAAISDAVPPGDDQKRMHPLVITNGGGGAFAWTASDDAPWITLSATFGTGNDTITVTVDPNGQPAGTHTGHVTVTAPGANGSPVTVPVTLTIQAPCQVSTIQPDAQVNGSLTANDCGAPHRPGSHADLYTFDADNGDAFSIRMTAPSLNSYLILTDDAGNVLTQNDECPGESRTACIRNYTVPGAGTYTIEATTSGAGETGNYTLSIVHELPPSAPQSLGQFKKDGSALPIGGTTNENTVVFKGTVSDPNSSDSVRLEIEVEPLGSPFTGSSTHHSPYIAASRGNVAVSITAGPFDDAGYHWQARSCDKTNRCSAWLTYGGNAETAADFTVNTAAPPPPPAPAPPPQGVSQ
ncbi:MAG TPA: BACON domain-containing carbohydrate-binding protein, partial [Gemmatimonadales bacterium]|nr:BACON domain-containing carbohydrate-binding protein [Gemmatimonadales bacterium]